MPDRPSILILDDDPDLLHMMERVLGHEGYRVRGTRNPREALTMAASELPSLVVVDLMLPEMDGEDFLRELRRAHGEATPAILIVSASAIREDIADRQQADASLAKPFDLQDLKDAVARLA